MPKLAKVNKTDRAQYVWCFQQREQLEEWWGTVAKNKRDRWGHPDTIKKQYLKAHGGDGQGDGQPGMPKAAKGTGAKPGLREEVVGLQEELGKKQPPKATARTPPWPTRPRVSPACGSTARTRRSCWPPRGR